MKNSFNKVAVTLIMLFYIIGMIGLITSSFWNKDISSFILNHFLGIGISFFIFLIGGFLKIFDIDDFEEKINSINIDGNLILLLIQILFSLFFIREQFNETVWILISPTLLIIFRAYFGTLLEIKKMLKNKE